VGPTRPVWLGTKDGKLADGGEDMKWKVAKPLAPPVQPLAIAAAPDPSLAPPLGDDPDFYKHLGRKVSYKRIEALK
jgi:hypothetical protein